MTLTSDGDRCHPATSGFRIEQESKDAGTTWVDRMYLFTQSGRCFNRDSP